MAPSEQQLSPTSPRRRSRSSTARARRPCGGSGGSPSASTGSPTWSSRPPSSSCCATGCVGAASTTDLSADGLARAAAAAAAHAALDREPVDARAPARPGAGPAARRLGPGGPRARPRRARPRPRRRRRATAWRSSCAPAPRGSRSPPAAASPPSSSARSPPPRCTRPAARSRRRARRPALDLAALVAAAQAGFHDGAPQPAEPGEPAVVLGPVAVAQLLEALKPELAGPESLLAARRGARIAAPCVGLADAPAHAGTLPRSYDAEGVPRRDRAPDRGRRRAWRRGRHRVGRARPATPPGPVTPSRGRSTSCSPAARRRARPSWPRRSRSGWPSRPSSSPTRAGCSTAPG